MPTHREKPERFDDVAKRRSIEVDEAVERARRTRLGAYAAQVASEDKARRATSVPPPPGSRKPKP